MADIRAFRAYRYDLGRVGALSDVIAPPYDVIDPALQKALYERSPHNVIRLILNCEEAADTENENRYARAGRCLRDWLHQGILQQDSARSLYVYHQDFEVEGTRFTRKGFLARVRLERFGEGRIYPHEETMSGPKADRLKLTRATNMNLSPIFGLFPDDSGVQQKLDEAVRRSLPLEATDHLGVVSRLWPVSDQQVVSAVTGLMGPKPIFIADGHHRYETALKHLEELRAAGQVRDAEASPNFVLMMMVSMSDPGLVILPTHRLVSGLPADLKADRLATLLKEHFQVETAGKGEAGARAAWETIEADGAQELLGFGTVADGIWQTARFRSPALMEKLAATHGPAWRSLAVSILHEVALNHLLRDGLHVQPQCRYVHLLREAIDDVAAKGCQLAALVPPATMKHVEQIAGNLERMPPKSTYFYPKLLSGLVFNPLTGN